MKVPRNISISITGLAVKTYMIVAVLWSKGNAAYQSLHSQKNTADTISVFSTES